MHTVTLSDSLAKEIDKVAHEFGFTEKQFVEDILREKILAYKKRLFVKGATDIRCKLALKDLTEEDILAEFDRFRHSQSGSPVA
jgi:metal-responsive CopG/Arc/MetJ family transcriptional regulator